MDRECPSSVTGAVMRKEGTRPHTRRQARSGQPSVEFQDAKLQAVDRNVEWPGLILATHDLRPLATWRLPTHLETATGLPVNAGFGASSGFPGSVCTLQSKITYWRLTAVTRSAA